MTTASLQFGAERTTRGPLQSDPALFSMSRAERRYARARADILGSGEGLRGFGVVVSGWVIRYKLLPGNRRKILEILLPGDAFGLDDFLFQHRGHALQAVTDVTYELMDFAHLREMMLRSPLVFPQLVWMLTIERRRLDRHVSALGRLTADERIAGFLLDTHARLAARDCVTGSSFAMPLTQQQLADYLGLTFVHVNRVLARLDDLKLATVRQRKAVIHDFDGLRAHAAYEDYGQLTLHAEDRLELETA